jgi:hypothetical protein
MSIKVTHKALWTPGWYELDQSLVVGQHQRFWFFQTPPSTGANEPIDFMFFNQMASSANSQVRYARVLDIEHTDLGPLQRIDTDGLDYIFYPIDGNEVVVNAEEEPGKVYDNDEMAIEDWSVLVTLADVSDPVADLA